MTTTNHVPNIRRWNTHPDRESLRVIYRFLTQREEIESAGLEPHKYHPRVVRATVSKKASSRTGGILDVRWYESGDFLITYQTDQADDASPPLRWMKSPEAQEVTVSRSGSGDVQTITPPSYHVRVKRFHPLQILPLVLATIQKDTK